MPSSLSETVESLRAGYESFWRGDLEAVVEILDPAVEWHNPDYAVEPGVRRGRAEFRAALKKLLEAFDYESGEAAGFTQLGDQVVVAVRMRATGKGSGTPLDIEQGHLWTVSEGRIVRLEWFSGVEEANATAYGRLTPEQSFAEMRRAYALASPDDIEAVIGMFDPEVEVRDRPEAPDPQTYHGLDGVRQALASSEETFESFELTPERFVEFGDRLVIVLRMRGRGRGSGVEVEDRIAHLWTLRRGRPYRMQVYSDPDQAVADAREAS